MSRPATRVYLTVDLEGAEERVTRAGGLQPALGYDLRVWGRFRNQPRDLGIGFILDALERAGGGLKATFFTEALGAAHFGEDRLAEVCQALRGRGHDVQLHLHPSQRRCDWKSRGEAPLPDALHAYPAAEQRAMIEAGRAVLARCGVPAETLRAFRAGGFTADNGTWEALSALGFSVDSSYDLTYLGEGTRGACRIRWPREEAALFHTGEGLWELPVTAFRDGRRFRHLQLMAVSSAEMRHALHEARALGLPEVCLVTHSFEFFYIDSIRERRGRPNWLNERRFEDLCGFLAANRRDFEVETVGALAGRLAAGAGAGAAQTRFPQGRPLLKVRRLLEQTVKRLEASRAEVPISRD